jgi:hypothetical protein
MEPLEPRNVLRRVLESLFPRRFDEDAVAANKRLGQPIRPARGMKPEEAARAKIAIVAAGPLG